MLTGVAIVVAGLLLLFHYGTYHWFRLDEWSFLTEKNGVGFPNLFQPYGGTHLVAVPRIIYFCLAKLFGITNYRPFQVPVVLTHLAIAVLLYAVIRRAGVRPWLVFACVALFVLVGPGAVNSVYGFQVGFNGSIAWGLGHLLLADHDGPPSRRDALGLVCGLLAITSSAVGVTMTVGVAVAVLLRRGWRMALLHGAPLLVTYGVWMKLAGADTGSSSFSGWLRLFPGWLRDSVTGYFLGLGRFDVIAWVLGAVVVIGMVRLWRARSRDDLGSLRATLAAPLGLAAAALFFTTTSLAGRWWTEAGPRALRYIYLGAVLVLPLVAVAAEAIAERWRLATPVLTAILLLPIPFNLANFDQGAFGAGWMEQRRYVLTTAIRMPFARDVPRDVRPMTAPLGLDPVTIGFLLDAADRGDLKPSDVPLTKSVVDEFKVRLGVSREIDPGLPSGCRTYREPVVLNTKPGDEIHLGTDVDVAIFANGRPSSSRIPFPHEVGEDTRLTIELPGLDLWVGPQGTAKAFRLCDGARPNS